MAVTRSVRARLGCLIALLALVAAACSGGSSDPPGEATKVTFMVANPVITLGHAHLAVAAQDGLYDAGGVDVEYLTSDGTVAVVQALAAGNAQMGQTDTLALMAGQQQGVTGVQAVCAYVAANIYNIIVPEDSPIRSVADLEGKKIGLSSLGTGVYYNARVMLQEAGLDPDNDVEFVTIEGAATQLQMLDSDDVDALSSIDVNIGTYENSGAKLRTFQAGGAMQWQWNLVAARTDFIESNPDAVAAVCQAIQEAQIVVVEAPDKALQAFVDWGGDIGTLTEEQAINVMMGRAEPGFRTYDEGGNRWGWYAADRMGELAGVYKELGLIERDPDLGALFTDRFFDDIQPDMDRVEEIIGS